MTETNETKMKSGDPQDCLTPAAINIENKEDLDVNSNVLDSTEPYSNDMESGNAKSWICNLSTKKWNKEGYILRAKSGDRFKNQKTSPIDTSLTPVALWSLAA